jgi:hypothetical protein
LLVKPDAFAVNDLLAGLDIGIGLAFRAEKPAIFDNA